MNINQWKVTVVYTKEEGFECIKTFQAPTLHELRVNVLSHLIHEKAISMECGNTKIRLHENCWQMYSQGHWYTLGDQTREAASYVFIGRMLFVKGDDYQDRAMVDGVFQLGAIRTIDRDHDIDRVNRRLARGWYILSLPTEPGMDFTLGHTEEDAI